MHRSRLDLLFLSFFVLSFILSGVEGFISFSSAGELVYSTYIGGSSNDYGNAITVDSAGNVYITGYTSSSNFPITSGVWDTSYNDNYDVFVTKLNSSGTGLIYSTYIGGNSYDYGNGVAVDVSGNAYITGYTYSSDFPTTSGGWDTSSNGIWDIFVSKLNPNGTGLVYSTYFGGISDDQGNGIAVDISGNAYITGWTSSHDFPITNNALNTSYNGGNNDGFITKFNPSGTGLVYSTYFGGTDFDRCNSITLDSAGNAYITGVTYSSNFPMTIGAINYHGGVFVSKLNPSATELVYSGRLGGGEGYSVAIDISGNAYVTGVTSSSSFPTTYGALYPNCHNNTSITSEGFVSKLNPSGSELVYSTYLGGSEYDYDEDIKVDISGNAYITGWTNSLDFPTTEGAIDTHFSDGYYDGFICKLNANGSALLYSTYFGGSNTDYCLSIAVDTYSNAYITGYTYSSDFPILNGGWDSSWNGGYDVFVSKLWLGASISPYLNSYGDFTISSDTGYWYFEPYTSGIDSGVLSWSSTYQNVVITQSPGQKSKLSQRFTVKSPGWYTASARVATDIPDISKQQKVYLYLQEFNQDTEIVSAANAVILPGNGGFGTVSTWRDISVSFYAQETNLAVQVISINPLDNGILGSLYLDDIWVSAGVSSVRTAIPITNASFNDGTAGWILEPYGDASYAGIWTTAWSILALVQDGGMKGKASQMFQLSTATKPVIVSAWICSQVNTIAETHKDYLSLYNYDSGYTKIIESGNAILQPGKWTPNLWHKIQFGYTPLTNYNAVQLVGINPIGNPWSTIYFDEVELKQ
jgi:hypothetical protein